MSVTGSVGVLHEKLVFARRAQVLAGHLAPWLPRGAHVLDVGCGDGTIDLAILEQRPDLRVEGIDVLARPDARIAVRDFDGRVIPFPDANFGAVMLVDVVHHAEDPMGLLKEAARVGKMVLIKDHYRNGFLAGPTLRLMDWVGNAHHRVRLPYNYWTREGWRVAFGELGMEVRETKETLGLYPFPANWIFERGLHFIAKIEPGQA